MSRGNLDVTITSLNRIDILALTLGSFFSPGMIDDLPPVRIILNVDPIGGDATLADFENLVQRYSQDYVINMPEMPDFCSAIKWCWQQIQSDLYLHLEDDWWLRKPIDFATWSGPVINGTAYQSALMRNHHRTKIARYSFKPHLAHRNVARKICDNSPSHGDAEQWAAGEVALLSGKTGILPSVDYPSERVVSDLGRRWAKKNGLKKSFGGNGVKVPLEGGAWFDDRKINCFHKLDAFAHLRYTQLKLGMRQFVDRPQGQNSWPRNTRDLYLDIQDFSSRR